MDFGTAFFWRWPVPTMDVIYELEMNTFELDIFRICYLALGISMK